MEDIYPENCDMDERNWSKTKSKDDPWILDPILILLKCPYYPQTIYRFNQSHHNSNGIFTEIERTNSKFMWDHKRLQITKAILRKMSEAGEITLSDFKQCGKGMVNQSLWYWHKHRHTDH